MIMMQGVSLGCNFDETVRNWAELEFTDTNETLLLWSDHRALCAWVSVEGQRTTEWSM